MPQGHRKRRTPCPHRRRRRGTRMLLRPHLLALLAREEAHGYHLYDCLMERGFDSERLDSSVVYRDLREMEESGLIASRWDDDSKGPRRRVYRIQPEGRRCLKDIIQDLQEFGRRIDHLVDEVDVFSEFGDTPER